MYGDQDLKSKFRARRYIEATCSSLPIITTETVNFDRNQNVSTHCVVQTLNPPEDYDIARHHKSDYLLGGNVLDGYPPHRKLQPSPSPNTDMNQPIGGPPVDQPMLMTHT
jgi:hypothetical protein